MNLPGHKASQHLVEQEAYRRIMRGRVPETLSEFAHELQDWLQQSFPSAAPTALHAIEDLVRDTWHRRHDLIRGG